LVKGDGLENIAYSLVKHGNFSFTDLLSMTLIERKHYYEMLKKEIEEHNKEIENARRK